MAGDEFGKTVRGIFCDSFRNPRSRCKAYYWTDDYLDEFKKRKGYDLSPHLLALWYDVGDKTPHIRHDFIHVLSQLIIDNFFIPLREWCEQNSLISRVQAHGSIGELLQSYASNSIGEGEQVTLREPQVSIHRKNATSSAHIYGKPLTSAESFTFLSAAGYPSSYRYVVNLELLKSVLDPALRDGYQEIINHGYTYNDPDDNTEPFHEMFASSVIRHTEPWWQYYHHFSSYMAPLLLAAFTRAVRGRRGGPLAHSRMPGARRDLRRECTGTGNRHQVGRYRAADRAQWIRFQHRQRSGAGGAVES